MLPSAPTVSVLAYLDAQCLDIVGAVSTAREVRQVELDLVPTFVESHRHRADERLDARRALVVTGTESSTNVLIIQHLLTMYNSCTCRTNGERTSVRICILKNSRVGLWDASAKFGEEFRQSHTNFFKFSNKIMQLETI